jgi:RNA polymerase sigma factor (sigma-70 family)
MDDDLTDKELLALDPVVGFEVVFRRHHDRLLRLIRYVTGQEHQADDCVQHAMEKLWTLATGKGSIEEDSAWSYLRVCALHEARKVDRLGIRGVPVARRILKSELDPLDKLPGRNHPVEVQLELADLRRLLRDGLGPQERRTLDALLDGLEAGLRRREIAERDGVPPGTFRQRQRRLRRKISQLLEPFGSD